MAVWVLQVVTAVCFATSVLADPPTTWEARVLPFTCKNIPVCNNHYRCYDNAAAVVTTETAIIVAAVAISVLLEIRSSRRSRS